MTLWSEADGLTTEKTARAVRLHFIPTLAVGSAGSCGSDRWHRVQNALLHLWPLPDPGGGRSEQERDPNSSYDTGAPAGRAPDTLPAQPGRSRRDPSLSSERQCRYDAEGTPTPRGHSEPWSWARIRASREPLPDSRNREKENGSVVKTVPPGCVAPGLCGPRTAALSLNWT